MPTTSKQVSRISKEVLQPVERITTYTDKVCNDHLDDEYRDLCRKLVEKLARKRPSPLLRGDPRVWAAAVLHAIGSVNFLFDRSQHIHMSADDLSNAIGVPKSTMTSKARQLKGMLKIDYYDRDFSRCELLRTSPFAWFVSVNGFIIDARSLPLEIQHDLSRRGVIPALNVADSKPI